MAAKKVQLCRCPSCNPIHAPQRGRNQRSAKHKGKDCYLCKNERMIPVERAKTFLEAYQTADGFG